MNYSCCGNKIVELSGLQHKDNDWAFNVCACLTCGTVFRMNAWPNKEVWALTMNGTSFKKTPDKELSHKEALLEGILVTLPSGLQARMLHERDYVRKYQSSVMARPTPNNISGWAYFVLKDTEVFDQLTDEDKLFLHDQQFEVYKVWGGGTKQD